MYHQYNMIVQYILVISTLLGIGCGEVDCTAISLPAIRVKVVDQSNNVVEPDIIQLSRGDDVVECSDSGFSDIGYKCFTDFIDGIYTLKVELDDQTFEKEYNINFDGCKHPEIEYTEVVTFNI